MRAKAKKKEQACAPEEMQFMHAVMNLASLHVNLAGNIDLIDRMSYTETCMQSNIGHISTAYGLYCLCAWLTSTLRFKTDKSLSRHEHRTDSKNHLKLKSLQRTCILPN